MALLDVGREVERCCDDAEGFRAGVAVEGGGAELDDRLAGHAHVGADGVRVAVDGDPQQAYAGVAHFAPMGWW